MARTRSTLSPPKPWVMTRCFCNEVSFETIAREVAAGRPLTEVLAATGAGGTCTACLPDLECHLRETLATRDAAAFGVRSAEEDASA